MVLFNKGNVVHTLDQLLFQRMEVCHHEISRILSAHDLSIVAVGTTKLLNFVKTCSPGSKHSTAKRLTEWRD